MARPVRPRRSIRRSNRPASQAVINKRMRAVWVEGSLYAMDFRGDMIREALRVLVDDDRYWLDLEKLEAFNRERAALSARLKGETK